MMDSFLNQVTSPHVIVEMIASTLNYLQNPELKVAPPLFVLTYILQLIVGNLSKTLLQIMTPEGFVKFRKSLPPSYMKTYLNDQEHFRIKAVIEQEMLEEEDSFSWYKFGLCSCIHMKMLHKSAVSR